MQDLVTSTEDFVFDLETQLENQVGGMTILFEGMEKPSADVCKLFLSGKCTRGAACPYSHVHLATKAQNDPEAVVCKHWLRGLCKRGDQCEFLHQYDLSRMPECFFFTKSGALHAPTGAALLPGAPHPSGPCRRGCRPSDVRGSSDARRRGRAPTGKCCNPECLFLHIDPVSRKPNCPWYNRGFCMFGTSMRCRVRSSCRWRRRRAGARIR